MIKFSAAQCAVHLSLNHTPLPLVPHFYFISQNSLILCAFSLLNLISTYLDKFRNTIKHRTYAI